MTTQDAGRLRVRALGHTIDLGVLPHTLPRLEAQWSRCLAATSTVGAGAVADEVIDLGRSDFDNYDYAAATQITLSAVGLLGSSRLNLHAAGLGAADGRVLTLVAPSGTGKTTACERLARDLAYVTDECVSVGPDEYDVLPFPKPLSIRRAGTDAPERDAGDAKIVVGPDQLGLARPTSPLRVGPLVFLDRQPVVDEPRLVEVDWTTTLLDLIPQTSALPRLREPLRVLVDYVRRAGGARRLIYSEFDSAAHLLHALLADGAQTHTLADAPVTHLPHWGNVPDPTEGLSDGRRPAMGSGLTVQRSAWTDAVRIGDDVLVLVGTQPVLLSGVGAALWTAIGPGGATAASLVASTVDALGEHPDAQDLVAATIDTLCLAGVLTA